MGGKHLSHEIMKQFHCLALLAAGVASSPIEILNYEAAEAGHGHVMTGTPGEAVMGEFYWKAPEGDDIKLVYTADMAGYVPTGAHLPLSPGLTPEVMEARAAFMDEFAKAQERAEEDMDMAVTAPERRRRDADANAQVLLTQPLHYAPNYPYYFVNNLVPTVKKVDEDMEMHMADETVKKVDEMEMKAQGCSPAILFPRVCPLLLLPHQPGPVPHHHRDQDCKPLVPSPVSPLLSRSRASGTAAF